MKIIVATHSTSTGAIVKNAILEANLPNAEFVITADRDIILGETTGDSIGLVDWEDEPAVNATFVKAIKGSEHGANIPVLLLATKGKAGTTFAGMKAGADGVITKPIDPDALVASIGSAVKRLRSKSAPKINVEFINPFVDATRNVLDTMAKIKAERKRLFLKDDHKMFGDVSGVMGLSGEATGSVVISLPKALAIRIVSCMLGGEDLGTDLSQDVFDGIGEVVNMISGQAKSSLTQTKYHFQISLPTVVAGPEHEIKHRRGTPNIVVLFETDMGENFAVQVCLSPSEE